MRTHSSETYEDYLRARYVAIIADGNGRWANAHGLPVQDGHKAGADTLKTTLRDAIDLDIQELML